MLKLWKHKKSGFFFGKNLNWVRVFYKAVFRTVAERGEAMEGEIYDTKLSTTIVSRGRLKIRQALLSNYF